MAIDIGLAVYNEWIRVLKSQGREPFASWASLGQELQDAWRAAAVAALHANDAYIEDNTKFKNDPRSSELIAQDAKRANEFAEIGTVKHLALRLGLFPDDEIAAEMLLAESFFKSFE